MPRALSASGSTVALGPMELVVAVVILLIIFFYWLIAMAFRPVRRRQVVLGVHPH